MSYLYVNNQGAKIGIDGGYFKVTQRDGMIRKIPSEALEYVAVFGNVQLTSQALTQCIKNGITVNFFSVNGSFFGKAESTNFVNISRQRQQFKLSGKTDFALELSKKLITAKIHNQLVVLKRYTDKNLFEEKIKQIQLSRNAIERVTSIGELIGHEGMAAKNYFNILGKVVNSNFSFDKRSRRPPKDAFNSMLSLGYTLLMHEIYGAIIGKGLNPYAGFLHQDHENHPTLASDLMEEWRAVLIDSLVMSLIQGSEVSIDGFYPDYETGAILLDKDTFSTFIKKYEKKMNTETKYLEYVDYRTSFRNAIYLQANNLVKAIEENNPNMYMPISLR